MEEGISALGLGLEDNALARLYHRLIACATDGGRAAMGLSALGLEGQGEIGKFRHVDEDFVDHAIGRSLSGFRTRRSIPSARPCPVETKTEVGDAEGRILVNDKGDGVVAQRGGLRIGRAFHGEKLSSIGEIAVRIAVEVGRKTGVGESAAVGGVPMQAKRTSARHIDDAGNRHKEFLGRRVGGVDGLTGKGGTRKAKFLHPLAIAIDHRPFALIDRGNAPAIELEVGGKTYAFLTIINKGGGAAKDIAFASVQETKS